MFKSCVFGFHSTDDASGRHVFRFIYSSLIFYKGHAVAWWLRYYATNRKVAGSRPDEVNF
jgi:hypothetical protein